MAETVRYFLESTLDRVPFVEISCLLYASIARKAALGGLKTPHSHGDLNDVTMMSTVLPYCDAVLLDRRMRGYLRDEPVRSRLEGMSKAFSVADRRELLAYLDEIEATASAEHLAKVAEVYGPSP